MQTTKTAALTCAATILMGLPVSVLFICLGNLERMNCIYALPRLKEAVRTRKVPRTTALKVLADFARSYGEYDVDICDASVWAAAFKYYVLLEMQDKQGPQN